MPSIVKFLLLLITASLCHVAQAQDSVMVFERSGTPDKELRDIMAFQGIEQFTLNFSGSKLKGKAVMLSFEEYKDGKVVSKAKLTQGLPDAFFQAQSDTFQLKMICQSKGDSTQVSFFFPRFRITNFFQTPDWSAAYSMRYVLPEDDKNRSVILANKERQALFTYSLPYEKPEEPGRQYYCELTRHGVPPEKWWETYHVKHFIIFYVQLG